MQAYCHQVLFPLPLAEPYDYLYDTYIAIGTIVEAPLGNRKMQGVVCSHNLSTYDAKKLRKIYTALNYQIPEECIKFIFWTANYTLSPAGNVLKMVMRSMDDIGQMTFYQFMQQPKKTTEKRQSVLDFLKNKNVQQNEIIKNCGVTSAVIKGLEKEGAIKKIYQNEVFNFGEIDYVTHKAFLNTEQQIAYNEIKQSFNNFQPFLLDGITGSGKTEVYQEIMCDLMREDKQTLLLVPEIALTIQSIHRIKKRFNINPAFWHSTMSDKERRLIWQGVIDGSIKIVVGARSGLFLPFKNLGLIIVDEEHDASYKQEDGIRYHARDMAVVRAKMANCPIILASATPSLESFVNAEVGRYKKLTLSHRHGIATIPDIYAINLKNNPPDTQCWISKPLRDALEGTWSRGEQALLFLNRRGYAPLTLCRGCGNRVECEQCNTWLVYHQKTNMLHCHQCGFKKKMPKTCSYCGAEDKFAACGPGVERLYEEVKKTYPHIKSAILSSDHLENPDAMEQMIAKIRNNEIQLLIGTQMIAKGHHFPNLTLVGIIDADLGLAGGDLRACERSFQLLEQVTGRAGRADKKGYVYLQTYYPDHPVMNALIHRNRDAFLDNEAEARAACNMPPFGKLAAIILSGEDKDETEIFAKKLASLIPLHDEIEVFGAAPAPIHLLRGRWRYRFLLKAERKINIQNYIRQWLCSIQMPKTIRIAVDIDPYSFL